MIAGAIEDIALPRSISMARVLLFKELKGC